MIYAYADSNPMYKGLLKIGYTTIDVEKRVARQYPTVRPERYENAGLSYTEVSRPKGGKIGFYDTVIDADELSIGAEL